MEKGLEEAVVEEHLKKQVRNDSDDVLELEGRLQQSSSPSVDHLMTAILRAQYRRAFWLLVKFCPDPSKIRPDAPHALEDFL